jgi:hypothetical protein
VAWAALLLALGASLLGADASELWVAAQSLGIVFVCCAAATAVTSLACDALDRR